MKGLIYSNLYTTHNSVESRSSWMDLDYHLLSKDFCAKYLE